MKKFLPLILLACITCFNAKAQFEDFRSSFDEFKKNALKEYSDFRDKANSEYASFLKQAWKEFQISPAIEKPKEKPIPPVVIERDQKVTPIEDKPIVIDGRVKVPTPGPQPAPLSPIKPIDNGKTPTTPVKDSHGTITVPLYGTDITVRVDDRMRFKVKPNEKDVARVWEQLSTDLTNNTIHDCLDNRSNHNLSDWAYLKMLDAIADEFLGKDTDESELLKAYLYCQSGYQMRLAFVDDHLTMLYGSPYIIYGKLSWKRDGIRYYCDQPKVSRIFVCDASFPGEKPMATTVTTRQHFADNDSEDRTIVSKKGVSATSSVNKNYIDFCNDFPSSQFGDDPGTRWAIYANTPTSEEMQTRLYPQLREAIEGLSDYDAVNKLCNWVQTAFVYEYDDKVWGGDRAFFPDETLYYPYCDCEDRSILLTRIVRDLLGLKCALVYYPNHLATAIAVGESAKGDFVRLDGEKYLVCDPTYIGANIGLTMPGMDNSSAKLIELQ